MKCYEVETKSNPGNWVISENRNTTIKVGEISDTQTHTHTRTDTSYMHMNRLTFRVYKK